MTSDAEQEGSPPAPGDIPDEEFLRALERTARIASDYLIDTERFRVLPEIEPGDIAARLAPSPPGEPESLDSILDDYQALIEPNVTHWNHPSFFAYFGITGSRPGLLGETLAASLNVNAMLWRSSPAATELEETVCDWLRQMLDLPSQFKGHINDTASISTMLALAVAREQTGLDIRQRGLTGRSDVPMLRVYTSDQAHSSVEKAAMTLGLGLDAVHKVPVDEAFRMRPAELAHAIEADLGAGVRPIAVVASAGTTSTTSVDPIAECADLCEKHDLWFHVDAAYAGNAAICPEYRQLMSGMERADSIVLNPHKWLFTQVDCSVLLLRDPEALKSAFSLIPPYLRTSEGSTNLMDYGPQLGRRFRALKLWMVIRRFGVAGLQERIRHHCHLAERLASLVEHSEQFELSAPCPFSTVCFRLAPEGLADELCDRLNHELIDRANKTGQVFLGPTELRGRVVLRLAIGNIKTDWRHVEMAWNLLEDLGAKLIDEAA